MTRVVGASGKGPSRLALELLGDVGGLKTLDLGAGGGMFAASLQELGAEPIGCDLVNQWQFSEIPFIQADFDQPLPFEDETFDVVTIIEALNYVESAEHVFREAHRVLKPGGRFVATLPNCLCVESRVKYLLTGSYRWFPHPTYLGGEKCTYSDLGRDPIRVSTAAFQVQLAGLELDSVKFGGSKVGLLGRAASVPIMQMTKAHNKIRKEKSKSLPPFICSLECACYRNVGILARKPA